MAEFGGVDRAAPDRSAIDEDARIQFDRDRRAGCGTLDLVRPVVNRHDTRTGLQRPKREILAAFEHTALDPPGDQAFAVATIDVLDHEAQRAVFANLHAFERAQCLDQGRSLPPRRQRSRLDDSVAAARRNRHDRARLHPELIEKRAHFRGACRVGRLRIARQVELVDRDQHVGKSEPAQKERLAPRLLRDTFIGGDHHDRRIDFGCAAEQVSNQLAVAGSIDEHEFRIRRAHPNTREVQRDRLIAFELKRIEQERILDRHAAFAARRFELFELCRSHQSEIDKQTPENRRLSRVDVADHHDANVFQRLHYPVVEAV